MPTRWTPKAVRNLRDRLGLSQEKMAQHLGVSFATVNRWEGGRTKPRGVFAALLDALPAFSPGPVEPGPEPEKPEEPAPKKPKKPKKPRKKKR